MRSRSVTQDQTKFDLILSALDNTTAAEVKSVLLNPPNQNKYETLKTTLLGAFGKSQARKDAELLNISSLGDRSPSALLRELESLNNDAETLHRALFLAQLPTQVRSILALQEFLDIHDLAKAADRIVEAKNISQTVTATNHLLLTSGTTQRSSQTRTIFAITINVLNLMHETANQVVFFPSYFGLTHLPIGTARKTLQPAAIDNGGYNKSTLSVWDRQTCTQFLVDTGADVCVFPVSALGSRASSPTGSLMAAN